MATTRTTGGVKKNEKLERVRVVKGLLEIVEKGLEKAGVKATFTDYIRLVQLRKELEEDEPRDIRVTWVEPPEEKTDGKS
ncbi:MAG: hypothetical protein ABI811_24090 [Acidobacteriota bacterium]